MKKTGRYMFNNPGQIGFCGTLVMRMLLSFGAGGGHTIKIFQLKAE